MSEEKKYPHTKESLTLLMKQIKKMQEDIEKVQNLLTQDPNNKHLHERMAELKWHFKNAMNSLNETNAIIDAEFSKKN